MSLASLNPLSFLPPVLQLYAAGALLLALLVIYRYLSRRTAYFYFVRHGETILNAQHVRQGDAGGLTEKGRKQARFAGTFLAQFPIRRLYASPFERTVETANIINESLRARIAYTPLLAERRNPSEIIGKRADDPEVKRIVNKIDLSFHSDTERYSDEENFADLKARARDCMQFLEEHGGGHVAVITHGIFLTMLLAYMIYGEKLHSPEYVKVSYFNPADNGGVTICAYRPWQKWFGPGNGWSVVAYNESASAISYIDRPASFAEAPQAAPIQPDVPAERPTETPPEAAELPQPPQ